VTHTISSVSGRSPITVAAGFLGAFIVGSLAVQLVHSQSTAVQTGAAAVEPVVASPATLWAALGERDAVSESSSRVPTAANVQPTNATAANIEAVKVEAVVGSEATLWAPLGAR